MEKEIKKEQNYVNELELLIKSSNSDEEISEKLANYHENDIAEVLERLTQRERRKLYRILGAEGVSEIFTYVEESDIGKYIAELELPAAAKILENMDSDEAADILEELDENTRKPLFHMLTIETRKDITRLMSYDEDEIGSIMTTNFVEIENDLTITEAMKELVSQAEKNDNISTIYVTNDIGEFYGAIDLKDLIVARKYEELESLISRSYPYVRDHDKISDNMERILDYAEDSIPILREDNRIVGVITAQDMVELVDDEMGEDYAKFAGLTAEEDLNETLFESMKKRIPWLIVLFFLGMLVSSVVGIFENVVSKVALIVCFQSLILDMAGNVGTQSLAVTIRVLMDEKLETKQKVYLVFKEMRVGLCNGLLLGSMSFVLTSLYIYFFKDPRWGYAFAISGCVGVSLLVSMIISSLVGTVVPLFFHKIKVDPAVASGPLITTFNDLVAVVTYYGLAWILLINMMGLY